jgi:beta-lactam-binding protein with PASTA domain/tRNA A-37 threonylcarbamoyl transferase component Bud32
MSQDAGNGTGNGGSHRVGGRYELGELLGRGGMAEVRKGNDTRLGRVVAVKRLRTDLASDQTFQARFRREAQSAASLNHPAIVAVYDTGEELSTDGTDVAQPYIVMEYVAGRTLRDILREGRKILPERALEITSGVLSALDYSHRAGIIHRDIKPGNVMLTPAGDVKVMDFGIARAMSDASSTMTQTAAVVGTAQYLSPEQARGETVDSRSDVYSTGCLLYELLTGRPPFVGESPVAVAYQHVREQAPPPSTHDEDLPSEVDAIVMKALAKRVEDRYQSAAAMKADIDRYLAGLPVQATVPPPPADDATSVLPAGAVAGMTQTGTGTMTALPAAEEERKKWPWVVLGVVLLVLAVLAAVFIPRLMDNEPDTVSVPDVTGMTERAAKREIRQTEGITLGTVERQNSTEVEANRVISQSPEGDETVPLDTEVDLVISAGPADVTVPNLVTLTEEQARAALEQAGLQADVRREPNDAEEGQVFRTDPGAGEQVAYDSEVVVYVSEGPNEVPDVTGRTEEDARRILNEAGFENIVISDDTSEVPEDQIGTVLRQTPSGGQPLSSGQPVVLTVSRYVPPEPEPDPEPTDPEPTEEPTDLPTGGPPTTPPGQEDSG